jgi:hypothetical protein
MWPEFILIIHPIFNETTSGETQNKTQGIHKQPHPTMIDHQGFKTVSKPFI